ncbi:M23 family metallopeptidase [Bradyrhizobium sp. 1]|uniref:M23 family metallopeptidase n=1 Tax=Bradyrhizobium sp. 1 TaxID=241591 RepID=UPI001FF73A20|nr:M23 family metallopeptidase [Bradyrhizobium sp. 1]MCK1393659.1 M23 family metallopeptidase [Bradyrhizobium sp. 1]
MSDPYDPGSPFRRTSAYGGRKDPITGELGKFHSGQDFAARAGTPIPAAAPGEVVYSGFNENFGNTVIVRNEAGYSLYAHMQEGSPMPKPGQRVWPGDIIGNVGSTGARSTGPHLHYSVIKNDKETRALGREYRNGGNLGVAVNGDTNRGPVTTIDPARFDSSVPYLVQAAATGASGSAVPSAPLRGLGLPNPDGVVADRYGAWRSPSGSSTTDPTIMAPPPGGLPGMIADYLRQSVNGADNSRTQSGVATTPAVPFVPANDPLSQGQPANFDDRFGDWSAVRRLSRQDATR